MALQLIFVVESNGDCQSDWIYIKETINRFFDYDENHTKLATVFMAGKGNYQNVVPKVKRFINRFAATSKENYSKVIYCFDTDNYDTDSEAKRFIKKVEAFCHRNNYEFVWFCKNVERVYLNKKIDNTQKKEQSAIFMHNNLINLVKINNLKSSTFQNNKSNIVSIINKFLKLK